VNERFIALLFFVTAACAKQETAQTVAPLPDDASHEGAPATPTWDVPALDLPSLTTGRVKRTPGKVTVIVFFATWHEPSKKAFPKLQELVDRYAARGLELFAISVDEEPTQVAAFANMNGARFPVAWDDGMQTAKLWHPNMMPTFFIIDRNGKNQGHLGGWHDDDKEMLEKHLLPLLAP